jgi:hypothetical protein
MPLPCRHCAAATPIIQPSTFPGFVQTDIPCEYRLHEGAWICLYCAVPAEMTTDGPAIRMCSIQGIDRTNKEARNKELDEQEAKRERKRVRERERRKNKREELAAIKKKLKTPIAAVKAAAKAKAEAEKLPSISSGKYMIDAPTGKGALVYESPEKIEQIGGAISRSEVLGNPTVEETGDGIFADDDRKRGVPEGGGAPSDEKPEITGVGKKAFTYKEEPRRKFQVKLAGPEYQSGLSAAVTVYTFEDEDGIFCRLCEEVIESREKHLEEVHGELVQKHVRKIKRRHAKLEKDGREAALEVAADQRAWAEAEAIKNGYVKVLGEWVLKDKGTA